MIVRENSLLDKSRKPTSKLLKDFVANKKKNKATTVPNTSTATDKTGATAVPNTSTATDSTSKGATPVASPNKTKNHYHEGRYPESKDVAAEDCGCGSQKKQRVTEKESSLVGEYCYAMFISCMSGSTSRFLIDV